MIRHDLPFHQEQQNLPRIRHILQLTVRAVLAAALAFAAFGQQSVAQPKQAQQATQQARASEPAYVLRGTVTDADLHTYKLLPFDVPAGTRRITVIFSHTGVEQRTTIDLGLYDSQRFRGWSGSDKKWFTISEVDATPSYLPGALPAGAWKLLLGIPNIRNGVRTEYTAKIYLSASVEPANIPEVSPRALRTGPGWYQGDLHDHTGHSDGTCNSMTGKKVPCPEFRVLEKAVALGLDFIAVTDHNTVSHHNALEHWQDYFDNMLLVRGREITTFFGHANLYGTSEFVDFRMGAEYTATDLAKSAHALGAVLSINHPVRPSGEICMGCGWTPQPPVDYAQIDAIEAINGSDADSPFSGIPFWEARLNDGHRITAIGGSDDHNLPAVSGLRGALGTPTTVVYAAELSERSLLHSIKAGHVFLKAQGPAGPKVFLTAVSGSQSAMVGDNLRTGTGDRIAFAVQVVGAANAKLEIIRDGKPAPLLPDARVNTSDETLRFTVSSDGARHWYRVNLRSAEGALLALTNPIYENFAE
jgi:hypothetical protein